MLRENTESFVYDNEGKEKIPEFEMNLEAVTDYVESLLQSQKNLIGKGNIAEVHHLESNPRICYKIICSDKKYNTINTTKEEPYRWYVPLPTEADFLLRMQDAGQVKVPRPYYSIVKRKEFVKDDEDELLFEEIDLNILAMERLNAVSVKDVIETKFPLPEKFNKEKFFKALREFVETMHQRNIYHRDLHEGNIMIDIETGLPYVIDFGSAIYSGSDEGVYQEETIRRGKKITFRFSDDFDSVVSVEGAISRYLGSKTREQIAA